MTTTHHGNATVTEDLFEGALAVVVEVHGEKLMMSDREFRDIVECARDLMPSMFQWRLPEYSRATDNGDPGATVPAGVEGHGHKRGEEWTFEIPMKPCGCGVLIDECCDCAEIQAQAEAAFVAPLTARWVR